MFRRFFWLRFFLTILIVGALAAGGVLLYNAGFTNGYHAALATSIAAGSSGTSPVPYYGWYPFWGGFGVPFFFPFGLLFGFGAFFLLIFLVSSLFRLWGWRRWAHEHGQEGPWFRHWEEHHNPPSEKGAGSGDSTRVA